MKLRFSWYVKGYLFQKFIHYYSIDWDKMQTLQKFSYDKLNRKNAHFSQELQLITILLLIEDLYMNWS